MLPFSRSQSPAQVQGILHAQFASPGGTRTEDSYHDITGEKRENDDNSEHSFLFHSRKCNKKPAILPISAAPMEKKNSRERVDGVSPGIVQDSKGDQAPGRGEVPGEICTCGGPRLRRCAEDLP